MSVPGQLFGADTPPGFEYRGDFISAAEEAELVGHINQVAFANFEMHGVVAKRRVAFFGASYDRSTLDERTESARRSLTAGREGASPPIPEFLFGVRERLAKWAKVDATAFAMALINEYREGSPIGWHRDAPQYDIVAGLSLLSSCRMRFRPYLSPKQAANTTTRRMTSHEITLMPRSAYIISAEARSKYEHSIPAVSELRYSITFRTLRSA